MLEGYLQRRKFNKFLKGYIGSPLYKTISDHKDKYFKYPRLAQIDQNQKDEMSGHLTNEFFEIYSAENPFILLREKLAEYVLTYAEYEVICLPEKDKTQNDYSDSPYISGELYKSIDRVAEHHDELNKLKWENPDISNETLIDFCVTKSLVFSFYVNALNHLRCNFDDFHKKKDWLGPFCKAMMIWQEHNIREDIGLPGLLPDLTSAIMYSTFLNFVTDGFENPYYEWERLHKRKLR